ncbi:MAG: sulfatase-like hydrolase/transferase [Verrucomicrobiales bacterium]
MRNSITRTLLVACALTACCITARAEVEKPNIVLILSDDQAWMDYGFMGHPEIKTPHLDKLASQSLVFPRGYVAAPICRPSLASIITGLFPFQHGVTGNDVSWGRMKKSGYTSPERHELDKPLRQTFHQHPSFVRMLTSNGYLAHQSGKWWEGSWQDGGFTHGMTHGDPKRRGRHGDAGLTIGRITMKPVTDFIDHATEEKKPFFVWYAPFLPHTPHTPPARLLEKYQKPERSVGVAKYYAMCDWFDETCGQLLDYLEEKELTENTLVIYACDNGWAPASANADDPNQRLWPQFALRSKGSPYENGIRTPIMLSWPSRLEPSRDPNLAHVLDLFPTIAAAAGLEAPASLPGVNLLDEQAREDRRAVFGVTHATHNIDRENPDTTLQYLWCIEGEWKLLLRYQGHDNSNWRKLLDWDQQPVRLYNIVADPHEREEVSAANPEIVEKLKARIAAWHTPKGVAAKNQ